MKFLKTNCVATKNLNHSQYCLLLTKLITEGYSWLSCFEKSQFFELWGYIGVDMKGEISLSDKPYNYLEINAWMDFPNVGFDKYPNVLTKEQIIEYLDEDII